MSGSATCERVGQNSGLLLHWVPDNSGQAPLMISKPALIQVALSAGYGLHAPLQFPSDQSSVHFRLE
jgi:hypothetical protein